MKKLKNYLIITILLFIFILISANSYANAISNNLSDSFFRLHIIANSNSQEDQNLKLKIRDEIIKYMESFSYSYNKEEIIQISKKHIDDFKRIAENVIKESGFSYNVSVEIGKYEFPTKEYGNISLPAGTYDALKIQIGDAVGKNWWCSLFPPLCFVDISSGTIDSDGENYLKETLSEEEFSIVTSNSKDIKLKFKIVELFNNKQNIY